MKVLWLKIAGIGILSTAAVVLVGVFWLTKPQEKQAAKPAKFVKNLPSDAAVRFHSVGYTDQMDSYMAASDLILGKTGGLTTSEALVKGLGFVVVDPIPGQEQRNADHLLEEGIAIKCNNWPVLAYKIDKLLDTPEHLAQMQYKARNLARPLAAHDIVEKLASL